MFKKSLFVAIFLTSLVASPVFAQTIAPVQTQSNTQLILSLQSLISQLVAQVQTLTEELQKELAAQNTKIDTIQNSIDTIQKNTEPASVTETSDASNTQDSDTQSTPEEPKNTPPYISYYTTSAKVENGLGEFDLDSLIQSGTHTISISSDISSAFDISFSNNVEGSTTISCDKRFLQGNTYVLQPDLELECDIKGVLTDPTKGFYNMKLNGVHITDNGVNTYLKSPGSIGETESVYIGK